jgi:hypothetical protein
MFDCKIHGLWWPINKVPADLQDGGCEVRISSTCSFCKGEGTLTTMGRFLHFFKRELKISCEACRGTGAKQ